MGELGAARADDPAAGQDMDEIRLDDVEQPLIMGDQQHRLVGLAHDPVDALADHAQRVDVEAAESVSSRMARRGSMIPICTISLRFFSPPEKPTFTARFIISIEAERVGLLARQPQEIAAPKAPPRRARGAGR